MEWWQILLIVLGSLLFLFLFFKIVQWDVHRHDVTSEVADRRFDNTRNIAFLASDYITHHLDPSNSKHDGPAMRAEISKQKHMTQQQRETYMWSMFGERSNNGSTQPSSGSKTYGTFQETPL